TGTIIGTVTEGRRPPLQLTSSTQPNPNLVYNDGFSVIRVAHERAFGTAQGYLHSVDQYENKPPLPAVGTFSAVESFEIPADQLDAGDNWIHVASIDST